jgi:flagellar biosynthesis protein FlhF
MKAKTFHGATMADALTEVKRHFGPGAIILNTRTESRGGILGVGGKPHVEITAVRDMNDVPPAMRRGAMRIKPRAKLRADGAAVAVKQQSPPISSSRANDSDRLLTEMASLRKMVGNLVRQNAATGSDAISSLPAPLYETYKKLVSCAVAEEVATQLVERVRETLTADQLLDPKAVRAALRKAITPMVPTAGPIRIEKRVGPYVVALIGPTGVGKTTTLAKLAANFCLREKRRVGMITLDTYRIGAIEQLKTYAQIIHVPLEVAATPEELAEAVDRMSDRDVILIDTAGRSQRDQGKLEQLRAFFAAATPDEVHLVLSGAAGTKVLDETIDQFSRVGFDRVIFTKLDEALGFGVILSSLQKAGADLSYVTTGQDVPRDISVGESGALAELVLGEGELQR